MNGKRRWRKSWEEKWRDEASDTLGLAAKALRAFLSDVADLEDGSNVGWAVDGNGRPYTRPRFARILSATEAQIDEALEQLVAAGVAVEQDGRVGLLGYRTTQEDPSAKRVREHRAKSGVTTPVTVTPDVTPESAPCNDQKTEDRGQINSSVDDARARADAAPSKIALPEPRALGERIRNTRLALGFGLALVGNRAAIGTATLKRIEADEALPILGELEALAKALGDPSLADVPLPESRPAVEVAWELHDARAQLGAEDARPSLTGELVREYFAPPDRVLEGRPRREAWSLVIRRALEEARRNVEDGRANRDLEFMTMASLGRKFSKYLANSDLDRRREPKRTGQARASPRQTGPRNPELRPIVRRDEEDET